MITFDRFTFAGPPRTARHWFVKSAISNGFNRVGGLEEIASDPIQQIEGKVSVTLVRHPLTWLHSMFRKPLTWRFFPNPHLNELTHYISLRGPAHLQNNPDEGFLKLVRDMVIHKGLIKSLFDFYQADVALRVEDLPWGARMFFESIVDAPLPIIEIPRTCADPLMPETVYTRNHTADIDRIDPNRSLRKIICKSEKEFCEKYNYY